MKSLEPKKTLALILLLLCMACCGCKVHKTLHLNQPTVCVPDEYQYLEEHGTVKIGEWWREFDTPELNDVVDTALKSNLDLKQSWWRLAQACAQARIQGAARFPEISVSPSALHFRTSGASFAGSGLTGAGTPGTGLSGTGSSATSLAQDDSITFYLMSSALSYEVDLWRRIDSKVQAACLEKQATQEDLEATALTLTGTIVDLWFTIQEQQTLFQLIEHQIEVSKTLLELVELRFSVGVSSALDVYQQRLQLAQTMAELPSVQSLLETSQNQMRVLMGAPPDKTSLIVIDGLVKLPPFPEIGSPVDLLKNRPDLRAQHRRVMSADYEVASAIADRFPRLDLSISYDFQATKIKELFDEEISRILGNLFIPVIDGGRRRAEVQRRKAIVCELLNAYGQRFLDALLEVEDALTQEKHQLELLDRLDLEISIAQANLEESRWHYVNGLNDYLSVIAAIQSLQNLERRMVSEKKRLLSFRTKLYRSLGGPYLVSSCF